MTSELEKLLAQSSDTLSSASNSVSQQSFDPTKASKGSSFTEKPLLNRISEKITGPSPETIEQERLQRLDRDAVAKEIDELRKKLNGRKQIIEMDKEVAKAKEEVVACLRLNDRRPLDCWQEVQNFKTEVGKLERRFVEGNER